MFFANFRAATAGAPVKIAIILMIAWASGHFFDLDYWSNLWTAVAAWWPVFKWILIFALVVAVAEFGWNLLITLCEMIFAGIHAVVVALWYGLVLRRPYEPPTEE